MEEVTHSGARISIKLHGVIAQKRTLFVILPQQPLLTHVCGFLCYVFLKKRGQALNTKGEILFHNKAIESCEIIFIHSSVICQTHDRSTASSNTIPPLNAI
jgi:hypothetical protein